MIKIKASDINTTDPVTITYSNSAGFSADTHAVRVKSDGTVVAPVPLYIDSATHTVTSGAVAVSISQDGQSSGTENFTINDLPPLSAYGTTPGQISHAFLIYETLLMARRMNELGAAGLAMGGKVDTANAVGTLYFDLIPASQYARYDVDTVMNNATATLSWGTLSDGTPVQFDSTQLDMMDRLIAAYLVQQFGSVITSTKNAAVTQSVGGSAPLNSRTESFSPTTFMSKMILMMEGQDGAAQLVDDVNTSGSDNADASLGWLDGMQAAAENADVGKVSGLIGLINGMAHVSAAIDQEFHWITRAADCAGDPACTDSEANDISDSLTNSGLGVYDAVASTIAGIPELADIESQAGSVASQSISAVVSLATAVDNGSMKDMDDASTTIATDSGFSAFLGSLGEVTGSAIISNSLGNSASQTAIELQQCTGCTYFVIGMADPAGDYELLAPLGVPGTDYSSMQVIAFDLATQISLTSTTVDLTGIDTSAPVVIPPMTGTCDDSDYGAPDEDDPDCD